MCARHAYAWITWTIPSKRFLVILFRGLPVEKIADVQKPAVFRIGSAISRHFALSNLSLVFQSSIRLVEPTVSVRAILHVAALVVQQPALLVILPCIAIGLRIYECALYVQSPRWFVKPAHAVEQPVCKGSFDPQASILSVASSESKPESAFPLAIIHDAAVFPITDASTAYLIVEERPLILQTALLVVDPPHPMAVKPPVQVVAGPDVAGISFLKFPRIEVHVPLFALCFLQLDDRQPSACAPILPLPTAPSLLKPLAFRLDVRPQVIPMPEIFLHFRVGIVPLGFGNVLSRLEPFPLHSHRLLAGVHKNHTGNIPRLRVDPDAVWTVIPFGEARQVKGEHGIPLIREEDFRAISLVTALGGSIGKLLHRTRR